VRPWSNHHMGPREAWGMCAYTRVTQTLHALVGAQRYQINTPLPAQAIVKSSSDHQANASIGRADNDANCLVLQHCRVRYVCYTCAQPSRKHCCCGMHGSFSCLRPHYHTTYTGFRQLTALKRNVTGSKTQLNTALATSLLPT
jgi:hypothetical protein